MDADDSFILEGRTLGRGRFRPWALLVAPESTRAFRFVYPTLVVLSDTTAYLWDVRTGLISQTIPDIQKNATRTLGSVNYVEVSDRHVFICGTNILRIFSRADGTSVYDISSTQNSYSEMRMELCRTHISQITLGSALVPHGLKRRDPFREPRGEIWDQFIAGTYILHSRVLIFLSSPSPVHVSRCGSHLVALLKGSILVVLYDFEKVIKGEVSMREVSLQIQLGPPYWSSRYLAFENDRVAVATVRISSLRPGFITHYCMHRALEYSSCR